MLKSYFVTAIRSLFRNKEYSLINILGLAISIMTCLLLFAVLRFETSFDTFHQHASSVYRVVMNFRYLDDDNYTPGVSAPAPEAIRADFPQLENVATVFSVPNVQINVLKGEGRAQEDRFREEKGVFFIEPEFFRMLDFEWLHGDPETSLTEPNLAVLTRQTAEKYFGTWQHAIGKFIQYSNTYTLKVSGILQNVPDNSDFPLGVVISFKTRKETDPSWDNITSRRQCYIRLPENADVSHIQDLMPAFEKKHFDVEKNKGRFILQPLSDIHFDERYNNLNGRTISRSTLMSLGVIGVFLLIIASINFINLAVAQVVKKAKEVGVRKVLGSNRKQLVFQFFGETFVIVTISAVIALVLMQGVLPFLRPVLNFPPDFSPVEPVETFIFLGALLLLLTFLSGVYPATVMVRFKPTQALKSKISNNTIGGVSLRKGLVVVQFMVAQILVIVTMVVLLQLNYFRSAPLGFDKEAILCFSIPSDSLSLPKQESFRNSLLQKTEVKSISLCWNPPSWRSGTSANFRFDHSQKDEDFEIDLKYADEDFFKTYNIPLVAGRTYQYSDTAREYVVNETFLKKFGIKDPHDVLGRNITVSGVSLPVVGVMKDFHLRSLHEAINPLAVSCQRNQFSMAGVKIGSREVPETIRAIQDVYSSFFPSLMFEYQFLDEALEKSYRNEERLAKLTNLFSGIAIFISCLGLYGLISFMAVQRTKEIGIRKVLGATVSQIVYMFSKEFILLVLIAFVIASPLAAYFMQQWLSQFAYHINLSAWIFLVSVAGTIVVALITLSFQSIKAALANPVTSLRNE